MSDNKRLEFFAWETIGSADTAITGLVETLKGTDEPALYESKQGKPYQKPDSSGWLTLEVLPFLKGLPLDNLVMAYVASLRPSFVRVSDGVLTLDAMSWRVTIITEVRADGVKVVKTITQEVMVAHGCGADVAAVLRSRQTGVPAKAPGGCIGNVKGLERVDFQ